MATHNAFHALSIDADDNRKLIFTPLRLTRPHLFKGCVRDGSLPMLDRTSHVEHLRLQEVWFSGPHSDVGGGYGDSLLGGTSLDWMIGRLEVLAAETSKPQDSRQNWAGVLTLRCCEADLHQRRLLADRRVLTRELRRHGAAP